MYCIVSLDFLEYYKLLLVLLFMKLWCDGTWHKLSLMLYHYPLLPPKKQMPPQPMKVEGKGVTGNFYIKLCRIFAK